MDLWRWAPVPSDLHISAGSSTSVSVLSDRQQLAVTMKNAIDNVSSCKSIFSPEQITQNFKK